MAALLATTGTFLGAATHAVAGAWTLEKGQGLVIATLEGARSAQRFDERGVLVPDSVFRKAEINLLAEYGISDRFTLRGRSTVEHWCRDAPGSGCEAGFAMQEIGGRLRVFERDGFVASVQGSLRADAAYDALGYEARLLLGYGFDLFSMPAFVDMQAGWRQENGLRGDEALLDLTLGLRPRSDVLLLLQSFSVATLADGPAWEVAADRHALQASAVVDMNESLSIQVGARRTFYGVDSLADWGLVTGVWWRF